ncbi:hypothetical protein BDN71DRAFT_1445934 [Pleurotus eryngii]|uniref:Uncharacterized protein n=1 Tax=Pleurotus eryngii TaxID=5323 RepID=A0A9P6D9T2_PLEER|nr:hypothetical protein BDN71DRAFT_1445934 [Pleurotus eryngii]
MVQSKTVILAAVLATVVVAVPPNGETNQVTQSDEASLIKAREPMLPPPGGFQFRWGGGYRPQIMARLTREVDDSDEALSRRMFIPPGQRRKPDGYRDQGLEVREPMIGISDLGNMPPLGWMSPWWNAKPVGSGPLRKPGQKRGDDGDDGLEAREPIPPRPFGHRYTDARYGGMNRFHPIRPAPIASRNYDYGDLEARERHSNGRYDTTKGPLPAYIPPNVREFIEARGTPFEGFRNGPPVGWASPWWKGKPVGMARDIQEEELEAREPIMMNPDAPKPPAGWKSPWFHARPVGDLRLRGVDDDDELETRDYDLDELD